MSKTVSHILSVVFHPLLLLTYMVIIILAINPYAFGVNRVIGALPVILAIFATTFVLPAFGTLMLKWLGFIDSVQLTDSKERIGPFLITGILYLWAFRSMYQNDLVPLVYTSFMLGATIALFLSFFINLFTKISIHSVGIAGCTTLLFLLYKTPNFDTLYWGNIQASVLLLGVLFILIWGIVAVARLQLKAHQPADIYGGLMVGIASQLIAAQIVGVL